MSDEIEYPDAAVGGLALPAVAAAQQGELPVPSAPGQAPALPVVEGAPPVVQTYPVLWYTSGSPINMGQRDCGMARYLGYHAGPHGTGWRRKAHAIPLATGGAIHRGHELICGWILDYQQQYPQKQLLQVPREVIAWAATEAAEAYEAKAVARGLLISIYDTDTAAANTKLIAEQKALIEALTWLYALARLPVMLSRARLLVCELEAPSVLDCSCGLGDWVGRDVDHAARGCTGIVSQARGDAIWEDYTDGTLIYEELKSKAQERKSWEDSWEHAGQLFLNMESASRLLGKEITHAFVPILFKGWRGRDKGAPITEPKFTHSNLIYGWCDLGSLDGAPQWEARYQWIDEQTGKQRRLGNAFRRTPVWDPSVPMGRSLYEISEGLAEVPADASRIEHWMTRYITPRDYADHLKVLGPFPRPVGRVYDATRSVLAEERLWRHRLTILRENRQFGTSDPLVTELIPRSWQCTRYDGMPCEFRPICDKEPGWESPYHMGRYRIRTPHHTPEKVAWEQAGLVFPEQEEEEVE